MARATLFLLKPGFHDRCEFLGRTFGSARPHP